MPTNNFPLSQKSLAKLATKGLDAAVLKAEVAEEFAYQLELWRAQGANIVQKDGRYYFQSALTPIYEAEFCIVDIETNGSKLQKHQIIEIAAVKVKNGKIIDRFESFVACEHINPHITQITGISTKDTTDAPSLREVMYAFRAFIADGVFVAHDVKFDYAFISGSMQQVGLLPLLNRSLCSIDLAERTIESYRYGLKYLNDYLRLHPQATHHRAMSDVITTYELFIRTLDALPKEIVTVEELIAFSKHAKRLKRPKTDPLLEEIEEKET